MNTESEGASEPVHGTDPRRITLWVLVLVAELLLVVAYATQPHTQITNPWPMVYPMVWMDASVVVLLRVGHTQPSRVTPRRRWGSGLLAGGYFLALGYFGGLYGLFGAGHGLLLDFQLPPGASPAFLYNGHLLVLVLQPYKVLGYLTLTYLVYRTVLDAAGSAVSGLVGLFSCVSCSWPLVGLVVSGVFGGTSAVAAVALSHDYLLSTLVFLSSVGVLYWQPRFTRNPLRWLSVR